MVRLILDLMQIVCVSGGAAALFLHVQGVLHYQPEAARILDRARSEYAAELDNAFRAHLREQFPAEVAKLQELADRLDAQEGTIEEWRGRFPVDHQAGSLIEKLLQQERVIAYEHGQLTRRLEACFAENEADRLCATLLPVDILRSECEHLRELVQSLTALYLDLHAHEG